MSRVPWKWLPPSLNRCSAQILLAITLAVAGLACTACAQTTEGRLEQYRCILRLPGPEFNWLAQDDIPGATLACRDKKDRFVILVVAKAPPGFYIDARTGAAFEKGMDRNRGIERLRGGLTNFLGLTCYEIFGRIETAQSLTVSRFFTANGFLYNLQAMVPEPHDGGTVKFDDLFAAFQFTDEVEIRGTGAAPEKSLSGMDATLPTPPRFASPLTDDAAQNDQPFPAVKPTPSATEPHTQASQGNPTEIAKLGMSRIPWIGVMAAGGVLGVIFTVILLRRSQDNRRVL